mmetsp:Transcript_29630/g.61121  ORF Transcript_29630/g.61121 Transcript_29630/m.61121 type:complete len:217 (+) Transcript_29630:540-1190(+)
MNRAPCAALVPHSACSKFFFTVLIFSSPSSDSSVSDAILTSRGSAGSLASLRLLFRKTRSDVQAVYIPLEACAISAVAATTLEMSEAQQRSRYKVLVHSVAAAARYADTQAKEAIKPATSTPHILRVTCRFFVRCQISRSSSSFSSSSESRRSRLEFMEWIVSPPEELFVMRFKCRLLSTSLALATARSTSAEAFCGSCSLGKSSGNGRFNFRSSE